MFFATSVSDRTGAFDIELKGHGRIAHVDPFGADDPDAVRALLIAAPEMLAALKAAEREIEHPSAPGDAWAVRAKVRQAIATAEGR